MAAPFGDSTYFGAAVEFHEVLELRHAVGGINADTVFRRGS